MASFPLPPPFVHKCIGQLLLGPSFHNGDPRSSGGAEEAVLWFRKATLTTSLTPSRALAHGYLGEVWVSSAPKKDGVSSGQCLTLKLHGSKTGQEYSRGQIFVQNTVLQHDWLFNLRKGRMAQVWVPIHPQPSPLLHYASLQHPPRQKGQGGADGRTCEVGEGRGCSGKGKGLPASHPHLLTRWA